MQLLNLSIERIITHQIYRRDIDGNIVDPFQSNEYTIFDSDAMRTFKSRVNDALGQKSKAVQMEIVHQGITDLSTLVDQMVDQDEAEFAVNSFKIANKLARAQDRRNYPGGIIVVFLGTQGEYSKKMFGIIKAEVHSGYEKKMDEITREISLKYVEELLLTPGTKLYKTVGFFENKEYDPTSKNLNDKWTVMVSDFQINKVDGKAAARYFHDGFLGCGYPQTSAKTTREFYDETVLFIQGLNRSESDKIDLLNALTLYMKADMTPTASISDFGSRYFDVDTQDDYSDHMEEAGIPNTAFSKDTEHIKNRLKLRQINFSSKVKLTAPPEVFREKIIIETIEGDPDESGEPTEWTNVIVKDRISQQE